MHRQLSRINETLYAESNTSVAKIWSNSVHVDTRFGLDSSGSVNRNVSASVSTVTDQSRCNSDPRKRESIDASVERIGCHSKRLKMEESKEEISESKTDTEHSSGEGSKPIELKAQPTEPSIQNYIHVRARRGQATDSHSLAERARREKISERMKILQDLVPGCNKVIGKALVLDEIINYIQSLQHQVEFLSMKLEAVNSQMNNNVGLFPSKDFGVHTYDIDSMPFVSEAPRQYPQGSTPEWLHMGFDRPV